ncbi:MAG: choice-of-anchor tandem repeat GloVer-containing protein [Tepidisphaeraceae bacterium]|jgi:uncharacterized repeat protein (TIGR03803 family)
MKFAKRALKLPIVSVTAVTLGFVGAGVRAATFSTVLTFDGPNGGNPTGDFIADAQGNLYGVEAGGLYEFDPNTETITTLATFQYTAGGFEYYGDGSSPQGGVISDAAGNLYGAALEGGPCNEGTVYELNRSTDTIVPLASFNDNIGGPNTGEYPRGRLMADAAGNLYGTTSQGGPGVGGTIFKLNLGTGTLTTLVSFNGVNGIGPSLKFNDQGGNLYGTTSGDQLNNYGTIFKLSESTGKSTVLASFSIGSSLQYPTDIVPYAPGYIYGTANGGGAYGDGAIFALDLNTGTIATVASFNGTDGWDPAGLIVDAAGNLFGTTLQGGATDHGTVFELARGSDTIDTLYSFTGGQDGSWPNSELYADSNGDLFGTTAFSEFEEGSIYELTGSGFVVVPEPSGFCLLCLAGRIALRRRRTA